MIAALALTLIGQACDEDDRGGTRPEPPEPPALGTIEIRLDAGAELFQSLMAVDSAWTAPGSVTLRVRYTGGCVAHTFRAVAATRFEETDPPTLPVFLRHDDHDDPCDAEMVEELVVGALDAEGLYAYRHDLTYAPFALRFFWLAPDSTVDSTTIVYDPLTITPTDAEREVEEVAMLLSPDPTPSPALLARVAGELAAIRDRWSGEIPEVSELRFVLPWVDGSLWLDVDRDSIDSVIDGRYHEWDEFNATHGVVDIEEDPWDHYTRYLYLWRRENLRVVADRYTALNGVAVAAPGRPFVNDDGPRIYPRFEDGRSLWFFRHAWEDCPAGCIYSHVWFFEVSGGVAELGGLWFSDEPRPAYMPTWWPEYARATSEWSDGHWVAWDDAVQIAGPAGSAPAWSPDGARIVFAAAVGRLVIVDAGSGPGVEIPGLPPYPGKPDWSPDGQWIVFQSNATGERDIWVVRPDGSNLTRLVDDPALDRDPAWSPDGTRIAFSSDRGGGADIWVMPVSGGTATRITSGMNATVPAWSPDGARIAFQSASHIWTVAVEGGIPAQLTFPPPWGSTSGSWPAWSPDGQWIAYVGSPARIWVIPAEGGDPIRLTYPSGRYPDWSPVGTAIVFSSSRWYETIWTLAVDLGDRR